jgi:hypothetical protein
MLQALSSSQSDHYPLLLCQQARLKQQQSFRFKNFWIRIPGFMQVVQEARNEQVPGISQLNILQYKMQHRSLRAWSNKLFGSARKELSMANEIIQHLDLAQENRNLSMGEFRLHKDLKCRVLGPVVIEHSR